MPISVVPVLVRAALRDLVWCRLRAEEVEVTFGHDLYVQVWGRVDGFRFVEPVKAAGLFFEPFGYPWPGDLFPELAE